MSENKRKKMSENNQETVNKLHCLLCNFKCCYQSNFNQHLLTPKHKKNANGINTTENGINDAKNGINDAKNGIKDATLNVCDCGKQYRFQSGLSRHKQNCNKNITHQNIIHVQDKVENQDKNKDNEPMILALLTQNKELMNLLQTQSTTMQEQSKTIQEMVPKMGNTTNNTTNNKFNLQVFLNEDCKDAINFSEFLESIQITVEDLENQAQVGYVEGISKLFLENLKELGVNRRPIHCTDKKRNTLYIKDNDEWDKEGSRDQLLYGIKVLNSRSHQRLRDMREENHEEYSDMDSDFSLKCMNIQRNLIPVFPRETSFGKVIASISGCSIVDRENPES